MKELKNIKVEVAGEKHLSYIDIINDTIDDAARQRGTGIARRTHEYLEARIREGKAVIALEGELFAGFCYIESWETARYVANSGLIVSPEFRGIGLAKEIKKKAFELSRSMFPDAKIFGLTTGLAVMKINHSLGYRPVTYSELTDDDEFWKGCQGCVNYDILQRMNRTKCLCTGMLYDPAWETEKNGNGSEIKKRSLLEYLSKLNPKHALNMLEKYRQNRKEKGANGQPKVNK